MLSISNSKKRTLSTATMSYANQQPSSIKNHVSNIAIVGVGGRSGTYMAKALIEGGKHRVTAITRPDSKNKVPSGVHEIKKVLYNDHSSLVEALKGQDVLIITMAVMAPRDSQTKLIDAAFDAGVRYIMPNEWGTDKDPEGSKDTFLHEPLVKIRNYVEEKGGDKMSWIALCCGFWYEFSLAGTEARYGFDFDKKTITLYDDGETKINTSTWSQVGRAVASLLSLKVLPDDENDKSVCLSRWNNKSAYISSFFVNQKDMLQSVLRVTGDKESDWTISYEDVKERYQRGKKMMQEGQMVGFGILLYARTFYKDGAGSHNHKLDNEKLGLPQEDFDEATKVAVKMAEAGETNAIH